MKAKRKSKCPFPVGCTVRIVKPYFVTRVGYPKSFHEELPKVAAERADAIRVFLRSQGVRDDRYGTKAADNVARALTHAFLGQSGFGGRTRSVHTIHLPEFEGVQTQVQGIRFVHLGEYYPPSVHISLDGDEYEPGGLLNETQCRILETSIYKVADMPVWVNGSLYLEIESANVELVAAEV